ncbi:Alpha/Beta hydrolase protein [Mycena belliarum]|uniref:Alpha/Beta hydrolase protein n=1 Tax=Mycena belliarum TaxID=1033014 RepID=A0AAD6XIP8_9AGAR|nr:Alpha/Beta hydrolase protein [Mycena belliae]
MAESVFRLAVPTEKIQELHQRLKLTRLPDELDDAAWDYGAPLADIRRLVERWQNGNDWREHEAQINDELPQFTRDIAVAGHGVLNIHYVHQQSPVPDAIPLLFVHGWPGNFLEVRKILPLFFSVVALSLPGYGFSEAPRMKGFKLDQYAEVGHRLMLALGYNEYVTQGGDFGFQITRRIARNYGGKAWHTNFPIAQAPSMFSSPLAYLSHLLTPYTPFEKAGLERTRWFESTGRGYYAAHATKPQTLGYALADSPVGLLAWIYEKLVAWTDSYPWDDDEGSYCFSRAGPAASLRIYYEVANGDKRYPPPSEAPTIPLGLSYFPKELIVVPRGSYLNIESPHDHGGHFAAHEEPGLLVDDMRKMFGKQGSAFGVVPGKTGYA